MIGAVHSPHHQHHRDAYLDRDDRGPRGHRSRTASEAPTTLSAGAYREEQAASFTFVTADGDKVTIDATATRELQYATYNADGRMATGVRASESSSTSLTVEGELDAAELRDIARAVTFLRKAAKDGALDEGEVAALAARRDLDSLQSVAGSIEVTRTAVAASATA